MKNNKETTNRLEPKSNSVDLLYDDRRNFCIIALTGYTASGCSRLAQYMEDPDFFKNGNIVRSTDNLKEPKFNVIDNEQIFFRKQSDEAHKAIAFSIFKRKFAICRNFIEHNYKPFLVIKYSKVIWLMAVCQLANKFDTEEKFVKGLEDFFNDRYHESAEGNNDIDYRDALQRIDTSKESRLFESFLNQHTEIMASLYDDVKDLIKDSETESMHLLGNIFRNAECSFNKFYDAINNWMFKTDYYFACFFYHRLGWHLRKGADLTNKSTVIFHENVSNPENAYAIVKFITKIIRSLRQPTNGNKEKQECRVVIDSIRTSLEARYLKERYSGFYFIAVHDEEYNAKMHLKDKMLKNYKWSEDEIRKNQEIFKLQIDKILNLGSIEQSNDDYEKGNFGAPNIEQCVADAEIHISNNEKMDPSKPYFCTMGEQWMKYASLIFHPGLITPSSEERCMVVAYTAKFNSGCVSRQVGAVITNNAHTIRTIGWNDVPYGQTPCSLRSLYDFANAEDLNQPEHSDFEKGKNVTITKGRYSTQNFGECALSEYQHLNDKKYDNVLNGLPLSYCFKSLHNKFEEEKNQVHTRSLHAEENAIMQMARFGGQGLENGIIYVTASPCELCCKKLYQIGVRKIIYIDEYPGISRQNIIASGYKRPLLKQFQGAYGTTYFKLYQPFMPYKDELHIRLKDVMPHEIRKTPSVCKKVIDDLKKNLEDISDEYNEDLMKLSEQILLTLRKRKYNKMDINHKEE